MYNGFTAAIKPSEKDVIAKVPFWVIVLVSYVCLTFGNWYNTYITFGQIGAFISSSPTASYFLYLFFDGVISVLFACVIGFLISMLMVSFSMNTLKIPRKSIVGTFLVLRSIVSLISGSLGFAFINHPIPYPLINNLLAFLWIFIYAFCMYYYFKYTYKLNSLYSSIVLRAMSIPYSVYLVGILIMGVIS